MIYYNTNHPILIKKIYLKIWRLSDEIKHVIKHEIKSKKESSDIVKELQQEYQAQNIEETDIADSDKNLDIGEDEMAKALVENNQEEKNEQEETSDDFNTIKQRRPKLSNEEIIHGTTILSEITMESAYIFSSHPLKIGESIILEYLVPNLFCTNAEVIACRRYNYKGRIISKNKHPYRVKVNFTFLKKGERTLLRNFIKSIEAEIPSESEIKTPVQKNDDDNFDDLNDLDL